MLGYADSSADAGRLADQLWLVLFVRPSYGSGCAMRYGAPPSLVQPPSLAEYCAKIAFPPDVRILPAVAATAALLLDASRLVTVPLEATSVVPPNTWHDVVSQMS